MKSRSWNFLPKPSSILALYLSLILLGVMLYISYVVFEGENTWTERQTPVKNKKVLQEIFTPMNDFDYDWPEPDHFAYCWNIKSEEEFCSALIAMKTLQRLSEKESIKIKPHYILIYSDLKENLVKSWHDAGGLISKVNKSELLLTAIKFDYTWIIQINPAGIPLTGMVHLFTNYTASIKNANQLIAAPAANSNEAFKLRPLNRKKCFDTAADLISTDVMIYQPSLYIEQRMKVYRKDNKGMDEQEIVNYEFSCNGELAALPQEFAVADYELVNEMNYVNEMETVFIYFGRAQKPWSKFYKELFIPFMTPFMKNKIEIWYQKAYEICNFNEF